ncbi:MAG: hypothetical protein K9M08_13675 [Pirellula sp.]|nr:hypothetical protein [Pirellula sp.]
MKIKEIYNWLVDHVCEFVADSKIVHKEIRKSLRSAKIVLQLVRNDVPSKVTVGCAVANDGSESYSLQWDDDEPIPFRNLRDLLKCLSICQNLAAV